MFLYFVEECKEKIYSKRTKKLLSRLHITDIICVIIWLVLLGLEIMSWLLSWPNKVAYICLALIAIETLIVMIWKDNSWNKKRDELKVNYENDVIEPLIKVMKSPGWKLYNRKGIQWAIDMCETEILRAPSIKTYLEPIKNFAYFVMLPIIIALGVKIFERFDNVTILQGCFLVSFVLIMLFSIAYIVFPFLEIFVNRKREFLNRFKDDLSFLLTKW